MKSENEKTGLKDRRVQRTQQLLMQALEGLIMEKPYADITVQDIIDRANVGRSTFYAHYLDKDHLLKSNIEKVRDAFAAQYEKTLKKPHPAHSGGNLHPVRLEATLFLFQHAQSYHPLYKALVGKRGGEWVTQQFKDYFTELLRTHLSELKPGERARDVPLEVLVQYMANALMGLLIWWLEQDLPYSAEQMNQWFHTMTVQSLSG